ncbi:SRPBCC family protein [Oleiharenicola sp. Vm1]|uniref:SRPBCC family protein n=1 Tax=Oleiharenicola sp. Vm1 TaxID=3398393 RepID=UPI0039F54D5C
MTTPIANDSYAEFPARGELRIVRLLPGPIERVWDFLTDPEKRARWMCGGVTEARPGGKIVFQMHHAKLSPGETPPEKWAHVHEPGVTFEGRVLRCEPPRLLSYTFGADDSVVTFELTAQGAQVLLVLTHRSTGEDIPEQKNYAGGWHTHLAFLVAILEGRPTPKLWEMHARLSAHYEQVVPR